MFSGSETNLNQFNLVKNFKTLQPSSSVQSHNVGAGANIDDTASNLTR
jgi:hypothetical protein